MKQLWAPWRMAYIDGDEPPVEGCLLCHIGGRTDDEATHVVERTELTFTMLNRYPYSSGHVMVIPTAHAESLGDLDGATSAAMLQAAGRATAALTTAMEPQGFNLGFNLGPAAGGSLPHLHLHVVPRWTGDTNFMPVLADIKVLPEHLDTTASRIREALANAR